MQLQVNWFRHAVLYGSYMLLLSLLLYSCHTSPATEFSHRLHTLKMMSCPFWASACDFFFFFFNIFDCRITQTSLDDVQQKWEEGRGGYRAQEEPITLWCRSRWRQEYFFIWMMLKEWHQLIKKKRFDEQKLHLRWGEGGEAVDNVFQCSWSQHC